VQKVELKVRPNGDKSPATNPGKRLKHHPKTIRGNISNIFLSSTRLPAQFQQFFASCIAEHVLVQKCVVLDLELLSAGLGLECINETRALSMSEGLCSNVFRALPLRLRWNRLYTTL
jgi:hypothetical protein